MPQQVFLSPRAKAIRLALALALVAQMALVAPGMAAAPPGTEDKYVMENATVRGHVGGYFYDYVLDGTTLYAGTNGGVQVFDVSDPANPAFVNEYLTNTPVLAVAFSGGNVFAAGAYDFWVVSPAGTPSLIGSCSLSSGNFSEMRIVGDRAILGGGARLATVDISDPSAPGQQYNIGGFSYVTDFDIVGDYAYLADFSTGQVNIVDISAGSPPAVVNTVDSSGAYDVDIVGSEAYVAMGLGLHVLDASEPGTPTVLAGPDDNYNGFNSVSVEGTACFLASNDDDGALWSDGLYIYDITDPSNPVDTTTLYRDPPGMQDLEVTGGTAFVMHHGGFRAYDVTTPTSPSILGTYRQPDSAYGVDLEGDRLYVGSQSRGHGVSILDVSEPGTPTVVGTVPVQDYFGALDVSGTIAYLSISNGWPSYTHEIKTFDVTNPSSILTFDTIETTQPVNAIAVDGSMAYAGQSNGVLQVVDVTNPSALALRGSAVTTPTDNIQVYDVVAGDGYAYVSYGDWSSTHGVAIFDVTNPDAPALLARYEAKAWDWPQQIGGLFLDGTTLWLTAHNIGLIALDVSDPANPVELSRSATSINRGPVWVSGGKAYVFTDYTVEIMDASDPSQPSERIGRVYPNSYESSSVSAGAANGDDFWFAGHAGVFAAQWGDYTPPEILMSVYDGDHYRVPITPDVEFSGDNVTEQTVTLDGQPYTVGTQISTEGTHTLVAWAKKASGVEAQESATFVLDFTSPVVVVTGVENGRMYEDTVTPGLSADDEHLLSITVRLDDVLYSSGTPVTSLGSHSLTYDARDRAGNRTQGTVKFSVRASTASADSSRLYGDSRYATAVKLSRDSFPDGSVGTVIVATGENFPDALAGAPLAWAYGSPILLVEQDGVPTAVAAEIQRLGATKAVILGGKSSVGDAVKTRLQGLGLTVERIAGDNRYHTAQLIAQRMRSVVGAPLTTAFIATGDNFPDAVAGAGIAAHMRAPILLVSKNSIPSNTRSAITNVGVTSTVVLGSSDVISETVRKALPSATRLGGTDRYDTARRIAEYALARGFWEQEVIVATGANFPDALAAGVVCAQRRAPAILVSNTLPAASKRYAQDHAANIWKVTVAGGTSTVPKSVVDQIRALLP